MIQRRFDSLLIGVPCTDRPRNWAMVQRRDNRDANDDPVGSKIEAIEGTVPARHSLVGRRAAAGLMPQRIADLAISVIGLLRITLAKTGAA